MVVAAEIYLLVIVAVMMIYAIRHGVMTARRVYGDQRPFYHDLLDSDFAGVSVLIPMHNEELVATHVLDALIASPYPRELLEVIPIDDHSDDRTPEILREYAARHPFIRPLFRTGKGELRGKPAALNDALAVASHDIVLVFDADYEPSYDLVRQLAMAFQDPDVGAVMGRVIPKNTESSALLPRLLDLERAAGYQVDQQARYSMGLVPQYGGTVGGFRRSLVMSWGGFDPLLLAEDTDMTMRMYTRGWRVAYANRAECYEEAPETWDVRFKQLRRWARGHTRVMFNHFVPVIRSPYLGRMQRFDAVLLLGFYVTPAMLSTGLTVNLLLFLSGNIPIGASVLLSLAVVTYNAFGNLAPFFQVGAAGILDGMTRRLFLLPHLFPVFLFNNLAVTLGITDAIADVLRKRAPEWDKTVRFRAAHT